MGLKDKLTPLLTPFKIVISWVAAINQKRLPGDVPLLTFALIVGLTFVLALGAMLFVSRKKVAGYIQAARVAQQAAAKNNLAPGATTQLTTDETALSTGTAGGEQPSAAAPAPAEPSPADQMTAALNQSSGSQLDAKVISFLLHEYEALKARIKTQDDTIGQLNQDIAAMKKKAAELDYDMKNALRLAQASILQMQESQKKAAAESAAKSRPGAPDSSLAVKQLADLYNQMKPNEVSSIVEDISDDMLVQVFGKMKTKNVAKILALMDPQRVAKLSKKMAGH